MEYILLRITKIITYLSLYLLEIEWCGSLSLLFLVNQYIDSKKKYEEAETQLFKVQRIFEAEVTSSNSLRRSLKQSHESSQINEWNLLAQVSNLTKLLNTEKLETETLRKSAELNNSKLTEVESFLSGSEGRLTLQLEEQLASCKLKVAELEAEKDYFEIELRKMLNEKQKPSEL